MRLRFAVVTFASIVIVSGCSSGGDPKPTGTLAPGYNRAIDHVVTPGGSDGRATFAVSVLLDSGSSLTEPALMLRHAEEKTTERHYAQAMQEQARDRARRDGQIDRGASLPERLDALREAWVGAFPNVVPRLGMDWSNVTDLESRRRPI
jgi:hypothetical protein